MCHLEEKLTRGDLMPQLYKRYVNDTLARMPSVDVAAEFLRPLTRCCPRLRSGLAEMIRKYSLLLETSIKVKHLIEKAFPVLLNFTKSMARFS